MINLFLAVHSYSYAFLHPVYEVNFHGWPNGSVFCLKTEIEECSLKKGDVHIQSCHY